jgi:DNA-damage-inducible protein J
MAHRAIPVPTEQEIKDAESAYDAWFRAEVEEGLREADDPNTEWVSNEEVERQSALQRAEWLRQIEAKRTAG